jgi:hypothetical protein
MKDLNLEGYLGIYAAIISSILLLWELLKYFHDKRSKMLVTGGIRDSLPIDHYGRPMGWRKYFFVEVTNRGNYPRFIHKPGFESNVKHDNKYFSVIDISDNKKYPYPLSPGEVYSYCFETDDFPDVRAKGGTKIRIGVNDTNGKRYYSKWIEI